MEKQPSLLTLLNAINLGHRHKHIAHLIDTEIILTKSIKKYCKNKQKIKIKINNHNNSKLIIYN